MARDSECKIREQAGGALATAECRAESNSKSPPQANHITKGTLYM